MYPSPLAPGPLRQRWTWLISLEPRAPRGEVHGGDERREFLNGRWPETTKALADGSPQAHKPIIARGCEAR